MRPAERIFGTIGVYAVRAGFAKEGADAADVAIIVCRNGLTGKDNSFTVDFDTGAEIAAWLDAGKPGLVQDVFPQLTVEQREMMISGMSDEEFDEACG